MSNDHFQNSTLSSPGIGCLPHSGEEHSCIAGANLTPGKQQTWLQAQPPPKTREESEAQKRVRRLIKLSQDEENE